MKTLEQINAEIAALEAEAVALKAASKAEGIKNIHEIMALAGLSLDDLRTPHVAKRSTGQVAPKYRDEATGLTWTGRGKEPVWIRGKERTQFLIAA